MRTSRRRRTRRSKRRWARRSRRRRRVDNIGLLFITGKDLMACGQEAGRKNLARLEGMVNNQKLVIVPSIDMLRITGNKSFYNPSIGEGPVADRIEDVNFAEQIVASSGDARWECVSSKGLCEGTVVYRAGKIPTLYSLCIPTVPFIPPRVSSRRRERLEAVRPVLDFLQKNRYTGPLWSQARGIAKSPFSSAEKGVAICDVCEDGLLSLSPANRFYTKSGMDPRGMEDSVFIQQAVKQVDFLFEYKLLFAEGFPDDDYIGTYITDKVVDCQAPGNYARGLCSQESQIGHFATSIRALQNCISRVVGTRKQAISDWTEWQKCCATDCESEWPIVDEELGMLEHYPYGPGRVRLYQYLAGYPKVKRMAREVYRSLKRRLGKDGPAFVRIDIFLIMDPRNPNNKPIDDKGNPIMLNGGFTFGQEGMIGYDEEFTEVVSEAGVARYSNGRHLFLNEFEPLPCGRGLPLYTLCQASPAYLFKGFQGYLASLPPLSNRLESANRASLAQALAWEFSFPSSEDFWEKNRSDLEATLGMSGFTAILERLLNEYKEGQDTAQVGSGRWIVSTLSECLARYGRQRIEGKESWNSVFTTQRDLSRVPAYPQEGQPTMQGWSNRLEGALLKNFPNKMTAVLRLTCPGSERDERKIRQILRGETNDLVLVMWPPKDTSSDRRAKEVRKARVREAMFRAYGPIVNSGQNR